MWFKIIILRSAKSIVSGQDWTKNKNLGTLRIRPDLRSWWMIFITNITVMSLMIGMKWIYTKIESRGCKLRKNEKWNISQFGGCVIWFVQRIFVWKQAATRNTYFNLIFHCTLQFISCTGPNFNQCILCDLRKCTISIQYLITFNFLFVVLYLSILFVWYTIYLS